MRMSEHSQTGNNDGSGRGDTRGRSGRGSFFWGAASALAIVVAAPLLRPAAKGAVKAGILLGRQARQAGSQLMEEFEDITAEARAELERDRGEPPGGQA